MSDEARMKLLSMSADELADWVMLKETIIGDLRSRVEELMTSNYKWQEKCADLEAELKRQYEYNKNAHAYNEHNLELLKVKDEGLAEAYTELARLREQVRIVREGSYAITHWQPLVPIPPKEEE